MYILKSGNRETPSAAAFRAMLNDPKATRVQPRLAGSIIPLHQVHADSVPSENQTNQRDSFLRPKRFLPIKPKPCHFRSARQAVDQTRRGLATRAGKTISTDQTRATSFPDAAATATVWTTNRTQTPTEQVGSAKPPLPIEPGDSPMAARPRSRADRLRKPNEPTRPVRRQSGFYRSNPRFRPIDSNPYVHRHVFHSRQMRLRNDYLDAFPLDPTRSTVPANNPSDHTAPTILLTEPDPVVLLP